VSGVAAWYVEQFNDEVQETVQADLALAIQTGYAEAAEAAKLFSLYGWQKAVPINRWLYLQEAILRLRIEHEILQTYQLPNATRSHYFGLVKSDSIHFTVAKVERPNAKPPRALFRTALQSPIQTSWLEDWSILPAPGGLCALLIHGPYRDDASRPAFLRIKFMDGADHYLPEDIDLHKKFLFHSAGVSKVHIPDLQLVRPLRDVRRKAT